MTVTLKWISVNWGCVLCFLGVLEKKLTCQYVSCRHQSTECSSQNHICKFHQWFPHCFTPCSCTGYYCASVESSTTDEQRDHWSVNSSHMVISWVLICNLFYLFLDFELVYLVLYRWAFYCIFYLPHSFRISFLLSGCCSTYFPFTVYLVYRM